MSDFCPGPHRPAQSEGGKVANMIQECDKNSHVSEVQKVLLAKCIMLFRIEWHKLVGLCANVHLIMFSEAYLTTSFQSLDGSF